jgi:hypothetical protein
MRLIDADKLKEELSYKSPAPDFDMDGVILGVIDEQPTASPWHRVEEEPKEPGKQYVVWASKGYAYCDKWLGDRWLISSVAPETVTHWMPLPEPPKEE